MSEINISEELTRIRKVCKVQPLDGEELDKYFIETDSSRDKEQDTRQWIMQALEDKPVSRVLFYGHGGCGKSTELNKFLSENSTSFLQVKISVKDEMTPVNINAEDLLLVMTERALATAQNNKIAVKDAVLEPVMQYFEEVVKENSRAQGMAVEASAGIGAGGSLPGLLKLFGKLSADVKFNSYSQETAVSRIRKRPGDLLAHANTVFDAINQGLKNNRRLLIVVEESDKLDIEQARKLFVKNATLLSRVSSNVIYTVPLFLFHSPDADEFVPFFDGAINHRMIRILDPPDNLVDGFDVVKDIVHKRIGKESIEDEALDHLVRNTAGVLRHVFDVLHFASSKTSASYPLNRDDIAYGLQRQSQIVQRKISLPQEPLKGGPSSLDELFDRLVYYARLQREGVRPELISDTVSQLLLKSCALVEYNGIGWVGVHPLVVGYLERLGRL